MSVNILNVSFICKFSSPTNSSVVDSATGERLFEFATPFGLHWRTVTTLRDADRRMVAEYKTGWTRDEVTYLGRTMLMSDWLVKKSVLSSNRIFVAPDGRSYEWEKDGMAQGGNEYKLLDCQTGELVAQGHRKRARRLFSSSEKLNIDVLPDGLPILDAIVFSFFLCELMARRRESANNRLGVGGAGMQGPPISG
ncbi:uncharacterized protein TRAVEDRAFT_20355 [Trametes versicolor FP-101664 SS1]|uniref:uncharacterized protein n=1 Tax=Trametes versicolor (strain FP-101664) TaxID=717944 RepID=UPI0004622441|nr:uncharacterized protein TRAVEDRAFT_20355 [Trametes versicolor FP-101664 SS1]EIW58307.1 hypothetical protein TRAVEDRAFT_20355 [Trametes versicolor FP-101664 SS1]